MRYFEKRLERLEKRFKFSKARVSHAKKELKEGLDLMRSRYLEAGEACAMDVEEIGKLKKSILEKNRCEHEGYILCSICRGSV
jgi:hypothetical protein